MVNIKGTVLQTSPSSSSNPKVMQFEGIWNMMSSSTFRHAPAADLLGACIDFWSAIVLIQENITSCYRKNCVQEIWTHFVKHTLSLWLIDHVGCIWVHALALFQIGKHSGGQAETIRTSGITLLGHINRCIYHILQGCVTCTRTIPLIVREITLKYNNMVNQFHKSHNAPDSHPTTHHSEQKHAHFCSEWWIAGFGTSDL